LAIESRQPDHGTQRFARREIERDHFILGHAIQLSIRPELQAARLPEFSPAIRSKDTNETAIGPIVFPDGRHCIWSTERTLTAHDHISVRRDCEVERAEIWILDLPGGVDRPFRTERQNSVVAFSAWADAGREKESAVLSVGKSARERDHHSRKHSFAS
jgi:hypothetical protein